MNTYGHTWIYTNPPARTQRIGHTYEHAKKVIIGLTLYRDIIFKAMRRSGIRICTSIIDRPALLPADIRVGLLLLNQPLSSGSFQHLWDRGALEL
jgi:hypothetical protein